MAHIIIRPDWYLPEKAVISESAYRNRRQFLKELGFTGGALLGATGLGAWSTQAAEAVAKKGYPYARPKEYDPGWPLTNEKVATTYNNFYEFSTSKERVHEVVGKFVTNPWPIEIGGLVEKPMKLDVNELIAQMPMEERVYRFRCVEAWSMTVPWTGFQLSKLLEKVEPKPEAKFVKFVTVSRPEQMPGWERLVFQGYPLPYTDGLRLDEAMHPLTLMATGIYGKPMPKQNGAPIRLVVPWKYGFKSVKSIVKIELVAKQPPSLWEILDPQAYPFESNVDPAVPHPRWSQSSERVVDTGDRIPTIKYNGYSKQVASLYAKK